LISLVSLPSAFVFRRSDGDPHPTPWLRVKLSCALGAALYPDPCWSRLASAWEAFYPKSGAPPRERAELSRREQLIPRLCAALLEQQLPALGGARLHDILRRSNRHPAGSGAHSSSWPRSLASLRRAPPTLAFAALGSAREAGLLGPEGEAELLASLLEHWALKSALGRSRQCARLPAESSRCARLEHALTLPSQAFITESGA
jgi:hypothetical protein